MSGVAVSGVFPEGGSVFSDGAGLANGLLPSIRSHQQDDLVECPQHLIPTIIAND